MTGKRKTPSKGTPKKASKPKIPSPAAQKNTLNRYFKVVDIEPVLTKNEPSSKNNTLNKFLEPKDKKKVKTRVEHHSPVKKDKPKRSDDDDDDQKECKYGEKCYQTNEEHRKKFKHPKEKQEEDVDNVDSPNKKEIVHELSESDSDNESKNSSTLNEKNKRKADSSDLKDDGKATSDEDKNVKKSKIERKAAKRMKSNEEKQLPDNELNVDEAKITSGSCKNLKPSDLEDMIKNIYGVEGMPTDFYHFWKFCTTLSPKKPIDALKEALNLKLVGPFDVLNDPESFSIDAEDERNKILLAHRYYYDPPEFQTCVISMEDSVKDEKLSGFHLGYYRDDPTTNSTFVAFNTPGVKYTPASCKIQPLGDNLFGAISSEIAHRLQQLPKTDKKRQVIEKLKNHLKRFMIDRELNYNLDRVTKSMKARQKTVVTKCFHGAGICVKVDETDVGYRQLPETDANLRILFTKITNNKSNHKKNLAQIMEPIEQMVNLVQFANDECDFGMGLELGLDLFSYGDPAFHPYIKQLLPLAYQLLNRPGYSRIIEAHLKNRDKLVGANHWASEPE